MENLIPNERLLEIANSTFGLGNSRAWHAIDDALRMLDARHLCREVWRLRKRLLAERRAARKAMDNAT